VIPCLEIESIYTWDKVRGINQDIVLLVVDILIFGSLLILIESGILKRVNTISFSNIQNIQQEFLSEKFTFRSSFIMRGSVVLTSQPFLANGTLNISKKIWRHTYLKFLKARPRKIVLFY